MPTLRNHPKRQDILDAIAKGISDTIIARQTGIDRTSILRLRHRITAKALETNTLNQTAQSDLPEQHSTPQTSLSPIDFVAEENRKSLALSNQIVRRLEQNAQRLLKNIEHASDDDDFAGVAKLMTTEVRRLEFIAKMAGLMDPANGPGGRGTNINVVVMLPGSSQPSESAIIDIQAEPDDPNI